MPARLARPPAWVIPVGASLLFLALWLAWIGYWLDDAFITFRYARNLAEGRGPVFNPGEAVEGYTSFLWMLATTVPFALLPEAAALRAIEGLGALLGVWVVWRTATFPAPDGAPRRRWTAALLAASPVFVVNCADGMETPLLMALLIESARAVVREPSPGTGALAGGLAAACALTRPEALPLLGVWPVLRLGLAPGRGRGYGWLAGFAAAGLAPVLLHEAWRLAYYGAPWPNTFYAKATGALAPRLAAGAADLGAFLAVGRGGLLPPVWLWGGLALALLGLWSLRREARSGARLWWAALWTPIVFRVAFDLWSGSETMGSFRFLAPVLPPLFVLADEAARRLVPERRRGAIAAALALAIAAASVGSLQLARARAPYRDGLQQAHVALGRWLRDTRPPGTWLALGDAGAIPFFSGLPVIDLWGLNDAAIARLPGEFGRRQHVADHVLARRPGVIVLWNLQAIHQGERLRVLGAWPFDREIAAHPVFRDEYRFVREWTFREASGGPNGYYLDVFLHRPGAGRRGGSGPGS